jgi:hypothetical protein
LDVRAEHRARGTGWRRRTDETHASAQLLLLPKQVAVMERLVENSEPEYQPKTVGVAHRLDECPSPLIEDGRTFLEIDPDTEQNFVRVSAVAR